MARVDVKKGELVAALMRLCVITPQGQICLKTPDGPMGLPPSTERAITPVVYKLFGRVKPK